MITLGLIHYTYITSRILAFCAISENGDLEYARRIFDRIQMPTIFNWNAMIKGYSRSARPQLGQVIEARKVFDEMPERSDVSWSAMISGYVQNKCHTEAIELFRELKEKAHLRPNRSVLVSVLNACAGLGASEEGRWVHSYIDENGFEYRPKLGTALVDFCVKCGCVESARQVFDKMPIKDVMAWSAIIVGLAINGHSDSALTLFAEMERSKTKPNAITFIGVLSACNHGGLVDKGWDYFKVISNVYGISPSIEHYGCMVDLLGRAGRVADAEQLINSMPMRPGGVIWGALLNGCVIHGHVELGEGWESSH
ncbi:hypothetical protein AAC387_Pa04g0606 [Persea americana]